MNLETICISGAIIAIPRLRPTNYNGSCSEQRAKNIHYLRCCEIYLLSLKNRWRMATRIQGEPEVCFLHFSTKWRREKFRRIQIFVSNLDTIKNISALKYNQKTLNLFFMTILIMLAKILCIASIPMLLDFFVK